MRALPAALLLLGLLAGCTPPPHSAYVTVPDSAVDTVPVGTNSVGEACRRLDLGGGAADIYCGEWKQPSARVRPGGSAAGADLVALANGEGSAAAWRNDIDSRFACPPDQAPRRTTVLGNAPAVEMECRHHTLGVTQVVLVANVGGRLWLADTISAAFDATVRSIGALAGVRADAQRAQGDSDPLLAERLAASSYRAGDIESLQTLMRVAADANRRGDTTQAEAAWRTVIALQEKLLPTVDGQDNPDLATAVMSLGLELSNQRRRTEAEADFARAERLIGPDDGDATAPPRGSDPTARARLFHYRALHAINRGHPEDALRLLAQAEQAYRSLDDAALDRSARSDLPSLIPLRSTAVEARFGEIDVKRDRAWALRLRGQLDESDREIRGAEALARTLPDTVGHWRERETAFVYRTHGLISTQGATPTEAVGLFDAADRDFGLATYGATLPRAETKLRSAAALLRSGRVAEALVRCHDAVAILRPRRDGVDGDLMAPCLDAYAAAGTAAQPALAEMFVAAQQVRSGLTDQDIRRAAQRMSTDVQTAELSRRLDEARQRRDALERDRILAAEPAPGQAPPADPASLAKLAEDAIAADKEVETLDAALQAKSPAYNQLVPKVVSAEEVMDALRPGEAFVQTVLSATSGWTFVLRDGQIGIGRIDGGRARVQALVQRLRATLQVEDGGVVRHFDADAAYGLYQAVLGPVAARLQGATTLTVAPAGPLLSVPFGVLLTGPIEPGRYADAPWLLRQFAIAHVPAPGNFLALRKLAGTSRARSWFGFGAAANVTQKQAERSFPPDRCGDAAAELHGLPRLDAFATQLARSAAILNAPPGNQLTGTAFTAEAVMRLPLKQYRVLQFAAHGLLPTELGDCQPEPAIVTSAPADAPNADGALLTASLIGKLDLDAELVILANCNSGGPAGATAGESLSGLARAFFAANARSLLVSHWDLLVDPANVLIPDTLARLRGQPSLGIAGALRQAQLAWLAGHTDESDLHPIAWGALAVFGDGGGGLVAPVAAADPGT